MQKSIRAAREIANQYQLPIPLQVICRCLNIELLFDTAMSGLGACFITHGGRKLIVVNDNASRGRVRFSVAHEIGHCVLGHAPIALNMGESQRPTRREVAANVFAAELLMPKLKLYQYGCLSAKQIASLCDVSLQAAEIRAREFGWTQ